MKKTVWATGLFAALITTGAWSLPLEQKRVRPDVDSYIEDADSFGDIVMEAAENIQATEASQGLAGLKPDMELVERGIFECTYHDNETTSTNKVLIRGTDSCGFLDANEDYEPKRKRVASYVNSHLEVFQPEKTSCFAVQSRAEDKGRKNKLSEYIEQMDQLPLSQEEIFQLQDEYLQSAINAEKFIKTELHGEIHYQKTLHNEQLCNMLLVTEDEAGQSNVGVRSCTRSCLNGIGMLVKWAGGWIWYGAKQVAPPVYVGYLTNWVTTKPFWDTTTDKIMFGEFAPNVTHHSGGLYGALNKRITTTPIGTPNTVSDYGMAFGAAFLFVIRSKVIAALGAMYGYALGRAMAPQAVKTN
ncbi:hypothetical protein [Endozoicomonas lisbonensis]|uniref:Uncharacterized protein n=1 Tax=Endozoicomonas lisbonensis TaxID=3120522 RepID=A0ABV2SFB5_9GAMM